MIEMDLLSVIMLQHGPCALMRYREHYKKSYEMDSTWKEEALKMKGHLEEAIKTEMREKDMTDSTLPEL